MSFQIIGQFIQYNDIVDYFYLPLTNISIKDVCASRKRLAFILIILFWGNFKEIIS